MILITGANGFLGSHICRYLLKGNIDFIALIRPKSDLTLLNDVKSQIRFHEGDILDTESLLPVMSEVDTIIHSAAVVSYHKEDIEMMNRVNIEGTRNMVNLALSLPIKYFIHISSVAALGRNKYEGGISEDSQWQESRWNTNYGESKYNAELEVWRGIIEGLNAVIINPSVILGPGDWERSSAKLFKYVWNEKRYYTEGLLNYVDVRDVASIVLQLLKKQISGERYIINAGHIPIKDFFEKIATAMNKKAPTLKANKTMLSAVRLVQKLGSIFSGKKPLITKESIRVGESKIYFDNSKIVQELNHNFVPLSDTINWTCEFYLRENRI